MAVPTNNSGCGRHVPQSVYLADVVARKQTGFDYNGCGGDAESRYSCLPLADATYADRS